LYTLSALSEEYWLPNLTHIDLNNKLDVGRASGVQVIN